MVFHIYPIDIKKWKYNHKPNAVTLILSNNNRKEQPIEQLSVKKRWKGLGIVSASNGTWNDHVDCLLNKNIIPWNISINTSYLQQHNVYRPAFTSIFKSIDYKFPATSMTSTK